jgi:hypothetical protein
MLKKEWIKMGNRLLFKDEIRNTTDLKIKLVKSGVWDADTLGANICAIPNICKCEPDRIRNKLFIKFEEGFVNNLGTGLNPSLYSMVDDSIKSTIADKESDIINKGFINKDELGSLNTIGYASLYNIAINKNTNSAIIEL